MSLLLNAGGINCWLMPEAADPVQEIAALRALLADREAELAIARAELTGARLRIEQYKAQLAKLRRMQFGRSSERLDTQIAQLELMLEDLEEGEAKRPAPAVLRLADQPHRERRQPAVARSFAARGDRA
jgi:transposase